MFNGVSGLGFRVVECRFRWLKSCGFRVHCLGDKRCSVGSHVRGSMWGGARGAHDASWIADGVCVIVC